MQVYCSTLHTISNGALLVGTMVNILFLVNGEILLAKTLKNIFL